MTPLALSMNPAAVAKRAEHDRLRLSTGLEPINRANGVRAAGGSRSKVEIGRIMHGVDSLYRQRQLVVERAKDRPCCTKCKTPFGICAKKDCGCHSF